MIRVACVAIIAGVLLCLATLACAQEAVPAFFTVVSEQEKLGDTAAAPSMILQVAAQTDIPQPKIFSVSVSGQEGANDAATSSCGQCNGNCQSPCAQSGGTSGCSQCGDGCNCNGCDACCRGCCDECRSGCFRPTWTFKAGAVVLDRVSPGSTALVVETGTGLSLMNASGFSFNWDGGVDASLIRRIGDDNALEARYFGINNWTARQQIVTTTAADVPIFPPVPIPIGSTVTSQFDANLYSAEVNWHHESSDTIGWLAGFRWLATHESLGITYPLTTVRSVTDNQLCGGQLGADLKVWEEGGPLRIDTVLKAGLYNNNASNLLDSRSQLSFVGEIGANIVYQCCDHVSLSFGYQVLWLTGVAVASDQIPVVNLATLSGLETGGNAFYHGAMFSVDCSW